MVFCDDVQPVYWLIVSCFATSFVWGLRIYIYIFGGWPWPFKYSLSQHTFSFDVDLLHTIMNIRSCETLALGAEEVGEQASEMSPAGADAAEGQSDSEFLSSYGNSISTILPALNF